MALRKVAECARAERLELICGTKLRKYVATVSQVLDMRSNELSLLCRHMGHSIHVHEDFCQLPSHTLELAKVSKLLIAVEAGDLTKLTGKTLNDLDLADIPDTFLDEGDSQDAADEETVATGSMSCGKQSLAVAGTSKRTGGGLTDDTEVPTDVGNLDTVLQHLNKKTHKLEAGVLSEVKAKKQCRHTSAHTLAVAVTNEGSNDDDLIDAVEPFK